MLKNKFQICAELGACTQYDDLSSRQRLLATALVSCPPDALTDILLSLRAVELRLMLEATDVKVELDEDVMAAAIAAQDEASQLQLQQQQQQRLSTTASSADLLQQESQNLKKKKMLAASKAELDTCLRIVMRQTPQDVSLDASVSSLSSSPTSSSSSSTTSSQRACSFHPFYRGPPPPSTLCFLSRKPRHTSSDFDRIYSPIVTPTSPLFKVLSLWPSLSGAVVNTNEVNHATDSIISANATFNQCLLRMVGAAVAQAVPATPLATDTSSLSSSSSSSSSSASMDSVHAIAISKLVAKLDEVLVANALDTVSDSSLTAFACLMHLDNPLMTTSFSAQIDQLQAQSPSQNSPAHLLLYLYSLLYYRDVIAAEAMTASSQPPGSSGASTPFATPSPLSPFSLATAFAASSTAVFDKEQRSKPQWLYNIAPYELISLCLAHIKAQPPSPAKSENKFSGLRQLVLRFSDISQRLREQQQLRALSFDVDIARLKQDLNYVREIIQAVLFKAQSDEAVRFAVRMADHYKLDHLTVYLVQ